MLSANPAKALFFNRGQKFCLKADIHFPDFIKKQRPAIGLFHQATVLAFGTGKRAGFMTKKFGFQHVLGDGGTVDVDKRAFAAGARIMQDFGNQSLARAGFPADQNA